MSQEFTPEYQALIAAGAMLANCAFNLAQSDKLDEHQRRSLDESCKAWDAALPAYDATLRQPAARVDEVCEGCKGHGEVGGLTPQGYDSQECPLCHGTGIEAAQPAPERQGAVAWPKKMLDRADTSHVYGSGYAAGLRDAEKYIHTHPAAPVGVPEGWVLVPREPTHAMCSAPDAVWHPEARKIWAQMLAAAPSAPVGVPDGMVLVPREALGYVSDLLAERKQGTAGRSPAHNARVVVDYWLTAAPSAPQGTQRGEGHAV